MIDLKRLLQVAPLSDNVKKEILEKADTFSPEKKFEFENLCWSLISQDYQNKLHFALQKATLEMAQGQKKYSQEDFKKIEDDLFSELIQKLNAANSQEQIDEIRKQIAATPK